MRFKKYDINSDHVLESQRYATKEAIQQHCLTPIAGTEIEVDEADLDDYGMTERAYRPSDQGSFPTQVKQDQSRTNYQSLGSKAPPSRL